MRRLTRAARVLGVLGLVAFIVIPAIPSKYRPKALGTVAGRLNHWQRKISISQNWGMYAPNPQRAQAYMNLEAHYPDGTTKQLPETMVERTGWGTTWAGAKTRRSVWRHYANFHPKKSNRNRNWYLNAVCVREDRAGALPEKIVMSHVRRRFTPPDRVRAGKPGFGPAQKRVVQQVSCKTRRVRNMIEADRERRGVPP